MNNPAPFITEKVSPSPSPSTGKDQVTAAATPQPAFSTSGFVEATFFPPHNEYDPNFGLELADLVTARYALTSDVTVFHKSGLFGRLYLFLPLGDSRPPTTTTPPIRSCSSSSRALDIDSRPNSICGLPTTKCSTLGLQFGRRISAVVRARCTLWHGSPD